MQRQTVRFSDENIIFITVTQFVTVVDIEIWQQFDLHF